MIIDYYLEKHCIKIAERPLRKGEDTLTSFNRDIFWYNRDTVKRQVNDNPQNVNYKDHRKAIETAVTIFRKDTQHEIALCILFDRHFDDYRKNVFSGKGDFNTDYSFLIKKIGMVFNHDTSRVITSSITSKLNEYTEPTLVQINHAAGVVTDVVVPEGISTLNEWAVKLNLEANSTCSYMVAGLKLGA